MDGLILLVILVPVIIILLQASILTRSGEHGRLLESLYDKIKDLGQEVSALSGELKKHKPEIALQPVFKESPAITIIPDKPSVAQQKPVIPPPEPVSAPEPVAGPEKIFIPPPREKTEPVAAKDEAPAAIDLAAFTEKKESADLEKFIGESVANKIGIAVLVLGIAFFVKYAIDKNWINEAGRVIIGLAAGGILIALAHRFRNTYRSFSSVLVGGGLTVFYFSIAFAFHEYHLIGQTTAFFIMVVISAFAVLLSLFYNRQELAVLAAIGGFITPFLVNTGNENYIALFTYLCILNAGLTALSWFKKWPAINTISLFFTTIIFGSWLLNRMLWVRNNSFPAQDAFLFAVLFYLMFIAMNILNSLRLKNRFSSFDFIILLSVNFLFYIAGISISGYYNNINLQGSFTLSLGVFNLLLTAVFYPKKETDRSFVTLLLGLSLTFISLTAPVWLKGNHITLFWTAEAVLLLFLYQRSKIDLLKIASGLVLLLMIISLFITWIKTYFLTAGTMPAIFNKGFITTLAVAAGLFLYNRLLRNEARKEFIINIPVTAVRKGIRAAAIITAYIAGLLEISFQADSRYPSVPVHVLFTQAYTFLYAAALLIIFRKDRRFPLMKLLLTAFCLVIYFANISTVQEVSETLLAGAGEGGSFIAHWVSAILLLYMIADVLRLSRSGKYQQWKDHRVSFSWIGSAALILILGIEMYNILFWAGPSSSGGREWWKNLYYKAGLSILWSICSFVLMWLGLKYDFRAWRIISLTLFTITLVKLFLYDIRNIPPGGKIAAFIMLGCLLLAVSFMYQRLKRIIIDNAADDKPGT